MVSKRTGPKLEIEVSRERRRISVELGWVRFSWIKLGFIDLNLGLEVSGLFGITKVFVV